MLARLNSFLPIVLAHVIMLPPNFFLSSGPLGEALPRGLRLAPRSGPGVSVQSLLSLLQPSLKLIFAPMAALPSFSLAPVPPFGYCFHLSSKRRLSPYLVPHFEIFCFYHILLEILVALT